jgi:uncharacterized protein YjbJ (UPF0337 family)
MSQQEASKVSAIKDKTVGAIKETVGNLIGNEKLELKGRAQKVHGKNEYEYAKAHKAGDTEPENFQQAYHGNDNNIYNQNNLHEQVHENPTPTTNVPYPQENVHVHNEQPLPPVPAPVLPPPVQQSNCPPPPPNTAAPIPPAPMPMPMPSQNLEHGNAEGSVESNEPSKLGALKDKTMGSIKQTLGSATGNQDMELKGKAQNIHGHHQEAFVNAQKEGKNEPEHFTHGTKNTDYNCPEGQVVGEKPSSISAMKDQAVGSVKESYGSATGNFETEMAGKAQQIHGKNEAEFAKAQKEGLNEPVHYEQGRKTTDHAQGEVVENNEPSKMSGYTNQALGGIKETWGSMTGNQQMEIQGKAQKMQGSNECAFADQKNTINA